MELRLRKQGEALPLPITFDLKDAGSVHMRTVEELRAFLQSELDGWNWLSSIRNMNNPNDVLSSIRLLWDTHWQNVNSALDALNNGNLEQAENWFRSYFQDGIPLPVSGSPRRALIDNVRTNIGERAAIGALAALTDRRFDGQDPEQVRGLFAAHEFLSGTGKAARQSVQSGLSSLLKQLGRQQERAEQKADDLDRRIEITERRHTRHFKKLLDTGRRSRREFIQRNFDEIAQFRNQINEQVASLLREKDDSIASIQQTEKTYSEHMGLKAPVTYWRDKAKGHRVKSWISGVVGLIFATSLVYFGITHGVSWILDLIAKVFKETRQWQATYSVLGIAAFVLTIIFWIGRLISRTYVSESHLAIDAEERAVMVETYLALTQENKIDTTERVLVLGSLFRASSDGLVRDDGAPDIGGLTTLLSKAGVGGPVSGKP
ncbi:hypothetical protein PMI01_00124 [Caulobacter sp. AP07]|uniref:DUF6161 domain-containing protein n=1 Tax=Caulobacter sp. AP07 TaxID=1144304 RepID=UPI000271F20F|nr:DUF6161 domain-containing protein [Caulobacter sp. AP07]EJL38364.1 hypothetical protein PMI01_00124 [Caulobacter sp. AP07]